ncbi:MAG: NUDIX domain-containing protein [Nitrospirota bacterium]|nr:MAG: NUDIX domain-containing protein [Nitrospirota bacterium]
MDNEELELVDYQGKVIGRAPRSKIHSNNSLLHRVVHMLIFNSRGEILLQRRSPEKDIAPGKWDTSVGGHVAPGESIEEALEREAREELSISIDNPERLYRYIHKNSRESELVYSFKGYFDGELTVSNREVSEVRFWGIQEIIDVIDDNIFSNNFRDEFMRYLDHVNMTDP